MLRNDTPVRGSGHGRQERREAGVPAEHFDYEKSLVRSSRGTQSLRELDRARNAGAEADAVIGAVYVVVHRFRNSDDVTTLVVQPFAVAQGVVTADQTEHF